MRIFFRWVSGQRKKNILGKVAVQNSSNVIFVLIFTYNKITQQSKNKINKMF
jgi:hypothetical protein